MDNVTPIRPRAVEDMQQRDRLDAAKGYLERSMGRILMCIEALKRNTFEGSAEVMGLRAALIQTLEDDVHNDLDVARENIQIWQDFAEAGAVRT